jgi:beta-glucanase (GH16 family)
MQSPHAANTFTQVTTTTALNITVVGLSGGSAYDFEIIAANSGGNGTASAIVTVNTPGTIMIPGAPVGLSAGTLTSSTVPLTWQIPSTGSAPTGYQVQSKLSTAGTFANYFPTSVSTNETVASLQAATGYNFQVGAFNTAGAGPFSSPPILVTTLPTPITGLVITATTTALSGISNPRNNLPWNSGCITSCLEVNGEPTPGLFARQYGYFEGLFQVPKGGPANTIGFWPAFVLYPIPTNGVGPGEIDIFEIHGASTNIVRQSIHNGQGTGREYDYTTSDMSVGFHRIAVDWQSNNITFYVDGVQTAQQATTSDMQQNQLYMNIPLSVASPSSWQGAPRVAAGLVSSQGSLIIKYVGCWANHAAAYPSGDSATATPAIASALFFDNFSTLDISGNGSATKWIDHFAFGGFEFNLSFVGEAEYMCSIEAGHTNSTGYQPFSLLKS